MNTECGHCKGLGKVQYYHGDYDTCPTCHGAGYVGTLPAGMAFEGFFTTREEAKTAVSRVMDGFKRRPE